MQGTRFEHQFNGKKSKATPVGFKTNSLIIKEMICELSSDITC